MIEAIKKLETELKIRGFSENTVYAYLRHNNRFLDYIQKEPEDIESDDIKQYMAYLMTEKELKPASVSLEMSALRFLYDEMMEKGLFAKIKMPKSEKKMPTVLTKKEIAELIDSIKNPKHKLLVKMLYSSGLRVGEAIKLKINDLDLDEKMGRVISGKGKKDRHFIISERLVEDIKKYLSNKKDSNEYIFSYQDSHIGSRHVQKIIKKAASVAGITKRVFPHAIRSSFATHLLESGTDIRIIQELLGHSNLATTQRYTKVSTEQLKKVRSPLDEL